MALSVSQRLSASGIKGLNSISPKCPLCSFHCTFLRPCPNKLIGHVPHMQWSGTLDCAHYIKYLKFLMGKGEQLVQENYFLDMWSDPHSLCGYTRLSMPACYKFCYKEKEALLPLPA